MVTHTLTYWSCCCDTHMSTTRANKNNQLKKRSRDEMTGSKQLKFQQLRLYTTQNQRRGSIISTSEPLLTRTPQYTQDEVLSVVLFCE